MAMNGMIDEHETEIQALCRSQARVPLVPRFASATE